LTNTLDSVSNTTIQSRWRFVFDRIRDFRS
jgi:hypothetical protein